MVSVLANGPKVHGFKPGRGDGFLKCDRISSTPSFGEEVKASVPCRKILRHVEKITLKHEQRYFKEKNHYLLPQDPPILLLDDYR
jgi:hypothetical protein